MRLLLTGCYRTGSEYLTQLIGNAPDIFATMYLTNFMRFCYGEYDPVASEANYVRLVRDTARRTETRWGQRIEARRVLDRVEAGEVSYAALYDSIMREMMPPGVHNWGEKTQLVWRRIPAFLEMFDDARTILIVRDPRSILASFKRFTYAPEPRYLGAVFNAFDAMTAGIRYDAELPRKRFRIVRFEDLVARPEPTVLEILDFLGLSSAHDLLARKGWTDVSGAPWRDNTAFDEDFNPAAAVDRWRGLLEPWEIALCERVNAGVMERFHYEPSGMSIPESAYADVVRSDPQIRRFFERWSTEGVGAEEYPTDPMNPANWAENHRVGEMRAE